MDRKQGVPMKRTVDKGENIKMENQSSGNMLL
jgi:hypothetical protein